MSSNQKYHIAVRKMDGTIYYLFPFIFLSYLLNKTGHLENINTINDIKTKIPVEKKKKTHTKKLFELIG